MINKNDLKKVEDAIALIDKNYDFESIRNLLNQVEPKNRSKKLKEYEHALKTYLALVRLRNKMRLMLGEC